MTPDDRPYKDWAAEDLGIRVDKITEAGSPLSALDRTVLRMIVEELRIRAED